MDSWTSNEHLTLASDRQTVDTQDSTENPCHFEIKKEPLDANVCKENINQETRFLSNIEDEVDIQLTWPVVKQELRESLQPFCVVGKEDKKGKIRSSSSALDNTCDSFLNKTLNSREISLQDKFDNGSIKCNNSETQLTGIKQEFEFETIYSSENTHGPFDVSDHQMYHNDLEKEPNIEDENTERTVNISDNTYYNDNISKIERQSDNCEHLTDRNINREFDTKNISWTESTQTPVCPVNNINEQTHITNIKEESGITERIADISENTENTDIKREFEFDVGKISCIASTSKPVNINDQQYITNFKQEPDIDKIYEARSKLEPVDISNEDCPKIPQSSVICNDITNDNIKDFKKPDKVLFPDGIPQNSSEVMMMVTDKHGNKSIKKLRVMKPDTQHTDSPLQQEPGSDEPPCEDSSEELDEQDNNSSSNILHENNINNDNEATSSQFNKIPCRICNKQIHKRGMTRHEATHGIKLQCSICPAKFSDKWNLQDHEVRHADPFMCDSCGKRFISRSGLNRHMSSHGQDRRPHECEVCKERFSVKVHLEGHRNSKHFGYKPFKCEICLKSFSYKTSVSRHSKECRGTTTTVIFNCPEPECLTVVKTKRALNQHMKGKHGEESHKCSCGKSFTWIRSFNRHTKSCTKQ